MANEKLKGNVPGLILGLALGAGGVSLTSPEPETVKVISEVPREPTVVENLAKSICIEGSKRERKTQEQAEKECSGRPKAAQVAIAEQAVKNVEGRPYKTQESVEEAIQKAKHESRRRDMDRYDEELEAAKNAGRMPRRPGEFIDGSSNPPGGPPPGTMKPVFEKTKINPPE